MTTSVMLPRLHRTPDRVVAFALVVLVVLSFSAPLLSNMLGVDPNAIDLESRKMAPCRAHLLGTDEYGRDVLMRILIGGRSSLAIGILGATVTLILGTAVAFVSVGLGGTIDGLVVRVLDGLTALPRLPLFMLLVSMGSAWGAAQGRSGASEASSIANIVLLGGFLRFVLVARVARARALELLAKGYVEAATSIGASRPRILLRHVLPNMSNSLAMLFAIEVPAFILLESALSFLGFGVSAPHASWGVILGQSFGSMSDMPWLMISAGGVTLLTTCAFFVIAESFSRHRAFSRPGSRE